jgi:hypothetical protein
MKYFVLAFVLLLSTSAFARQYIQCSMVDTSDVMVVNLQTSKGGTLFLSSGMQNPEDERILVNIEFDKIHNSHHVFKVLGEVGEGSVAIPSRVIGKSSDSFLVDLMFADYNLSYSCFSRIYND